jgi:peptidoglycan hydrolase-like protein with peptidoglycan-binding domain
MTRIKAIASLAVALAPTSVAPAHAHGGFTFNFGIALPAPAYVPPPVVYTPPPPTYVSPYVPAPFFPPTRSVPAPVQPDEGTRWVQQSLNVLGYGPLNVDGLVGPATASAIMQFQAANGLAVDGIAGSATTYLSQRRLEATAAAASALAGPPPGPQAGAPATTASGGEVR